jgi:hypothetical protein
MQMISIIIQQSRGWGLKQVIWLMILSGYCAGCQESGMTAERPLWVSSGRSD